MSYIKNMLAAGLLMVSFIAEGQQYAQSGQIQLSTPGISAEKTFFEQQTAVTIELDVPDVVIRYTLDDTAPTQNSIRYAGPILLQESATVRARAFHADFKPSDVVALQVYRLADIGQPTITFAPQPSEPYAGEGAVSLTNRQKGSFNFRDGQWLGFSADTLSIQLQYDQSVAGHQLLLSVLEDSNSWIFAPLSVIAKVGDKVVGKWELESVSSPQKQFRYIVLNLPAENLREVDLEVKMGAIPDWHPGSGNTPWLFIDEILLIGN